MPTHEIPTIERLRMIGGMNGLTPCERLRALVGRYATVELDDSAPWGLHSSAELARYAALGAYAAVAEFQAELGRSQERGESFEARREAWAVVEDLHHIAEALGSLVEDCWPGDEEDGVLEAMDLVPNRYGHL